MTTVDLPQELKLSDAQIIEVLWKLTAGYKALREQMDAQLEVIQAMVSEISFIIDQTLEHRLREEGIKYHNKLVNTFNLARRVKGLEEELDGLLIHYTDTLKEIRTNAKARPKYKY